MSSAKIVFEDCHRLSKGQKVSVDRFWTLARLSRFLQSLPYSIFQTQSSTGTNLANYLNESCRRESRNGIPQSAWRITASTRKCRRTGWRC
jgi:hypothetical protein